MPISMEMLQARIKDFAKTISSQPLGLAKHLPHPDSIHTSCISNVEKFLKNNGGSARYGWYFLYRTSAKYGDYLIATYHAVWHNPQDLCLVDVTPFHPEEKHRPISPGGNLLFLVDDVSKPISVGNLLIPHPSRFYPIGNNAQLVEYTKSIQKEEYAYYEQQYGLHFE